MKPIKFITGLLFTTLFAMALSFLFSIPFAPTLTVMCLAGAVIPQAEGVLRAVTVEIWQKDIIDNLFKNNEFAARAYNADQFVVGGKIVHIPVAGLPSASQKNVTAFPIAAVKRADDEVLYGLDTYYQPPKFVEKVEQYELSYDKRQSIMGEQQAQLIQDCIEGLLYRWSLTGKNMDTPGSYTLTVGADTSTDVLVGSTGDRKTFSKAAFGTIKKKFDNANILTQNRIAVLTANHHQQFLDSLSDAERTNVYRYADMSKGLVGMYLGFEIYMRSTVQRWRRTTGVWAPVDEQAVGFAAGANDSAASIFYQEQCAERALGEVNVFDSNGRPEYYGDLFSMNMRLGGRQRRSTGVVSVIEDIS